jgi:hypothetical protein
VQFSDPIGQHNPEQIGSGKRDEEPAPELLTWLTARLRFWIICSLLPPDEDESGVPA